MSKKKSPIWETLILFRRSLIYQTKEFFQNSTLHGVRYIAESGRPIGEKFMWFCFTAIGTVTALIIIMSLWQKFQTNPTITGLDTDFHNQHVMFPTTVMCPDKPYDEQKLSEMAFQLSQNDNKSARIVESFLSILMKLSFDNIEEAYALKDNFTQKALESIQDISLRSLVFQIKINSINALKLCKYRDEDLNCSLSFHSIYTEHGFCFAFNSRYKSTAQSEVLPPFLSGFIFSCRIDTVVSHDLYETDKKWALFFIPVQSSKIFIFSHEEFFGWDFKPQLNWESKEASEILVSKKNTYTTDDARQLTIGQRKCIFPDEVKLTYFKTEYTFSSCMNECRIKTVIKLCRCLPPFFKPISNIAECKFKDFKCLIDFKANITNLKDCLSCELGCSKTVYNVEKLNKNADKKDNNGINVEFLTWPIIRYKREVLFGWVDLLVSFGGIAGLFLGFSLLSGVEIIYYFTMRACCMVYRNREELYAIEEDISRRPPPHVDMSLKPNIISKRRRTTSTPPSFLPIVKVHPTQIEQKNIPVTDGLKKKIRGRKPLNGFSKPIFKQVKTVSNYNNFYKSRSEPPQFVYMP